MPALVALQGNNAMPNALGAFADGQKQAAGIDMAKKQSAQKAMELIGSVALGAMGGKMDGQPDPQVYEQGLDMLQGYGVDVSGFRGKPQLAPVAARASLSALQQLQLANDDRAFAMAMEKFDRDMMEADRSYGLARETLDFNKQKAAQPSPSSPLGKLAADRAAGLISQEEYDAAVKKATAASGTSLSVTGPDGSVIEFGQGSGVGLGRAASNTVQDKAIDAAEMGARVAGIMADFKPEYQTLGNRLGNLWTSGKARISPESLGKEERSQLEDFATFRARSIDNLNRLLNELSGAAVSPQEGKRIAASMPNPGTGLFDGDDPVSFEAKLKRAADDVERALARYQFYQVAGLPGSIEDIPLADVQKVNGDWYVKKDGKVFAVGQAGQ